jgi:hypothetical protein
VGGKGSRERCKGRRWEEREVGRGVREGGGRKRQEWREIGRTRVGQMW